MIVRIVDSRGDPQYIALHADTRTGDVWVPIRGDRGRSGEVSVSAAIEMCVDDLDKALAPLLESAQRLYKLCDIRGRERSIEEERKLRELAKHLTESLSLAGINLSRLLDTPTANDHVDIDADYEIIESTETPDVDIDADYEASNQPRPPSSQRW